MSFAEHHSLALLVSDVERARAENWLKDAYADGRLGELELDRRLGQVMTARTRRDLNAAFLGVAPQARAPLPAVPANAGHTVGAVAHLSALFTWALGPFVVYCLAAPGSFARREAAKAVNFQVLTALAGALVITLGVMFGIEGAYWLLLPLGWLGWLAGTLMGAAQAARGRDWRNPALRVAPVKLLPERTGRR